jgi:hypothetical protein
MIKLEKNIIIRIAAAIMAMFMLVMLLPTQSVKAVTIDTARQGSMTVSHVSVDEEGLEGVNSHIYRVASIDSNGVYTILDGYGSVFSDKNFFNNGYDFDAWKSCVEGLADYVKTNKIAPYMSGVSNAEGKTYFTGLELGVYLVLSDNLVLDKYIYSFVDFIYPVPLLAIDDTTGVYGWKYDVSASPKKTRVEKTIDEKFKVLKRWSDSGNEDKRPESISVSIYCDQKIYKKVTLSASNNWKYSWTYEPGHEWKLVETSTGKNYTASLSKSQKDNEYTFIFVNTYSPDNPPETPETPDTPDETPEVPSTPATPSLPEVLGAIRDLPEVLGARRLPQTGQLWWPIPLLILAGLFLIIKGIRKNKNNA